MSQVTIKNNNIAKWDACFSAKNVYITNIDTEKNIIVKKENILYQFHDPVSSFIGREQSLQNIHHILVNKNIAAVCGLGGIGKSEFVRAYGKTYRKFYNNNILWINSETNNDILKSFRGLAIELDIQTKIFSSDRILHQIVTDIYNYLKKQTLVIFDNAVCYNGIKAFLPSKTDNQHIHVLISSQNIEWGHIQMIQLGELSDVEARDLIISQLNEYLNQSEKDVDVPVLVSILQNMPLALQQAVAYIIDKKKYVCENYTIRDYINEVENEGGSILKHNFEGSPFPDYFDPNYDKTIAITVQMMIDKIKNVGKDLPLILLYLISYLPSDNIDKELFTALSETEAYREESLDDSIRLLAKYSALTVQSTEKSKICMHRLVQKLLRSTIKSQDLHKTILEAAFFVTLNFVHVDDIYFSSVLNYVKPYPDIYLPFFEKDEDNIGILNLITRPNCFAMVENILQSENIDLNDNTMILQAVRSGNLEMVKFLVGKGANIHSKDNRGWTLFHCSCIFTSTEMAQYFIDLGFDINEVTDDGFAPLQIAAACGNIDMVKLLFSNRVKVKVDFELSPLVSASLGGHLDILKLLIEKGIPTKRQKIDKMEGNIDEVLESIIPSDILGQVLEKSYIDVINYLLENDICKIDDIPFTNDILCKVLIENHHPVIDFCIKNYQYSEALLYGSAFYGNDYAVLKLLKQNVDVNYKNKKNCTPVYIASQEGHLSVVKILIEHGADIHLPRDDNETPLGTAARNGRMEIVKYLVKLGADVNVLGTHMFTPAALALGKGQEEVFKYLYKLETISVPHILIASYTSNIRMAEYLISNGAKIDSFFGNNCYNALMNAAELNNIEIMKFLLDKGSDPDVVNADGETALFYAVSHERAEAVKLLVRRGADVNIERNDLHSALNIAVLNNYKEIVEVLVENKAKINREDNLCIDALCCAISGKNKSLLEYLIIRGGQINRNYESSYNLLGYATAVGDVEIFEYLVELDPLLLLKELEYERTVAHVAAECGHVHMFDVLLKKGLSLIPRDDRGTTPISVAAYAGKTSAVEYLLQIGCDVDCVNDFGNALLQNASGEGHLDVVHLLLRHNATVDLPDWEGDTALHEAAAKGMLSVVKCLLDHGANINLANLNGMTPLHLAVAGGHLEIVEYLLNAKAQATLRNNMGLLPWITAQEKGHLDIVECFKRFSF